jgi:hypothetical protein
LTAEEAILAQPPRPPADTAGMTDTDPNVHRFYTTLWIAALRGAIDEIPRFFSKELADLAAEFFAQFPPLAKA